MEIKENKNPLTKEESYNIFIRQDDNLNEWDIVESFKEQYPNKLCSVAFSRVVAVECGIILIGLNIINKKRTKKESKR
ncbi:hypothetical protein LCGC14_2567790 [marine sediment metagenome]|uniref:Uncharacterized protein n=1 Tax=marine sediment metagenome TaxID=412755 RepID=A0A0F9DB22_9ZZZZ